MLIPAPSTGVEGVQSASAANTSYIYDQIDSGIKDQLTVNLWIFFWILRNLRQGMADYMDSVSNQGSAQINRVYHM